MNSSLARSRAPNYAHTLSDLMPFFCLLPPHSRAPALAHTLSGSLDSVEGPLGGQDSAGALMTSLESQTEQDEEEGKKGHISRFVEFIYTTRVTLFGLERWCYNFTIIIPLL